MTRKSTSHKSTRRKASPARRPRAPSRTRPTGKPDAIGPLVDAGVQALALPIEASWHAGVKFNLQLLFKHAALIDEFSLADEAEPAPVFRA
jgi:hypothetical protein